MFVSGAPNIFSDQQEQYLGDAMAEMTEADLRLAPESASQTLTRIGDRLLAALPPTSLHYRFRVYESGELNAFSLGGGRVYVSRKLIAATANEDELAGILAHEIGHIATHQFATEFTRTFRIRIGVTQVTDRADIFARVHQMFNTPYKPAEGETREDKDQLLADHAGLYAMVRAGYAPESFTTFLDKLTVNKGKKGNAITDFFGTTRESSQRYRTGLKLLAALPPGCKGQSPAATEAYLAWQRSMMEERIQHGEAQADGQTTVQLSDPLRPDLWNIRFSPDGRFLLAQDEGGISVVERAGSRVLFHFDAPDAHAAQFSPTSDEIVFDDASLRVERWNVASGKRTSVKELVVYDGCDQSLLAPDGTTLVCFTADVNKTFPTIALRMIDVDSGKPYFENANFYQPTGYALMRLAVDLELKNVSGMNIVNVAVSQDGRYMLATVGDRSLAFDFKQRQPVVLGGKLRGIGQTLMAFLDADRLFVRGELGNDHLYKAEVLSFPDGKVIATTKLGDQQIASVTRGALIKGWPLKSYAIGVIDPLTTTIMTASKTDAMDVWNQEVAVEGPAGGLQLATLGKVGGTLIPLPLGRIPRPRAVAFSPDGKYLAVSLKGRGELWNLNSGQRIGLMRPFRSAWMDDQDRLVSQFKKYLDKDPLETRMTPEPLSSTDYGKYEEDEWQYRDMQVHFKPNGRDKSKSHNAVLEVKAMGAPATAWTRNYPHEMPACWNAEDDRLVLAWDLTSDTARGEVKGNAALQKELESLKGKKRGLLIETVALATGAPLQQVVIPEADLSRGLNDERHAAVSGEYVLVHGEHGNTAIYRLYDGSKVGEFFGQPIATSAPLGIIAASNREDEIVLLDERTAREVKRITLGSPIRAAHLLAGTHSELLVLTADQVVHRMSLPATNSLSLKAN